MKPSASELRSSVSPVLQFAGRTPFPPQEILILKPSSMGDVIHTLPAVACLKKQWPGSRLHWLVNPEWAPLLHGNPDLASLVIFPRGEFRGLLGWTRIPSWLRRLHDRKADLILDFQGLLRSALIGKWCRRGALFGLSDAREGAGFFYDEAVPVAHLSHAVDRYLALVAHLGVDISPPLAWPLPQGELPRDPLFSALVSDSENPRILVLHPFSRGSGKSLSVAEVMAFCEAFTTSLDDCLILLAGRSEVSIPSQRRVLNGLNRTTLPELLWLLRRASAVVSVDSGPMHLASALGVPLLSLHTWSDPEKVGPYSGPSWVWKNGQIRRRSGARDRCNAPPLDSANLSRESIAPTMREVAAFAVDMLRALKNSPGN